GITLSHAAKDPYDTLYDAIMLRQAVDGKVYGHDEPVPLVFGRSAFPFDPASFEKLEAALKEFESLQQETIEKYSDIKKAILQRHLWVIFDATMPGPDSVERKPNANRAKLQARIASLIKRLALSKEKILALPNTGLATIESGNFAVKHDPNDHLAQFLPADLYAENSSWVCIGRAGQRPTTHSHLQNWRSAFFQFVKAPGGREATIASIDGINRGEVFPVGTQFALTEHALLISDKEEMVLSPLVFGIQLRAYLDVTRSARDARPSPTQCVTEFVMQPRQLMRGNAVMKAIGRDEGRWKTFNPFDGGKLDPFELGETSPATRMTQCVSCHGNAGIRSLGDFRRRSSVTLEQLKPNDVTKVTLTAKRADERWTTLVGHWK
ncbi:MAG: hypothetical protein ACI9HK_006035, partial [Pirellulaceae bacterium]